MTDLQRHWDVEVYCDDGGEHRPVILAIPMRSIQPDGTVHQHFRVGPSALPPDPDAEPGGLSRTAYRFTCTRCSLDWRPSAESFWPSIERIAKNGARRVDARLLMKYLD